MFLSEMLKSMLVNLRHNARLYSEVFESTSFYSGQRRSKEARALQPNYISISTLFSAQTRHTIPMFQRPYVWTRADQWEPLSEDIGRAA